MYAQNDKNFFTIVSVDNWSDYYFEFCYSICQFSNVHMCICNILAVLFDHSARH